MFYAIKLPSGIARISTEKPSDDVFYVELEELPDVNTCLYFNENDELYGIPAPYEQETPENSEPEDITSTEMASAIMEGVNNV